MALLKQYDPPALLTDLDQIPNGRAAWHEFVHETFKSEIAGVEQTVGTGNSQYYTEVDTSTSMPSADATVTWNGFPQTLIAQYGKQAYNQAEVRQQALDPVDRVVYLDPTGKPLDIVQRSFQDEYLEWHADYDTASKKIKRITFSCEGPEYWEALAGGYPRYFLGSNPAAVGDKNKLLQLYRSLVEPTIMLQDLLFATDVYVSVNGKSKQVAKQGDYNPYNQWNTQRGIVHLTHVANTLGAEIDLGAISTILWSPDGKPITSAAHLICCGRLGGPNRSSDPTIAQGVNGAAWKGAYVTLKNPVGLYMAGPPDMTGWTAPDGSAVDGTYWTFIRPNAAPAAMGVRGVLEVPPGKGFMVGDIKIGGAPIDFPGQVAEHITMQLTAVVCSVGKATNKPVACIGHCCRKPTSQYLHLLPAAQSCAPGEQEAFPGQPLLMLGPLAFALGTGLKPHGRFTR